MANAPKRMRFTQPRKAWGHSTKTTTQRGYGWQHQKARDLLFKIEPHCRECKKANRYVTATIADHVVPLAQGGKRDASNLQPLCKACSDLKTQREAMAGRRNKA